MRDNHTYYFDHNATTPVSKEVLDAMSSYFSDIYGNASSNYYIGRQSRADVEKARGSIAKYFNMSPEGVYFTNGGSESDNMIIKGIAYGNRKKGNHIITSKIEHPAVLKSCKYLEENGFEITYLDVSSDGFIDLEQLRQSITDKTILISIMYANNEIGTIQPIQEIGKIAKEHNVIFHTDAVQAVGEIRIDVQELNINAMSISGHKFYGPKGIGVAYIKPGINFEPLVHGGSQEYGKRAGTENNAGIIGIAKAIEILDRDMEDNVNKLVELKEYILGKIGKVLDGYEYRINGDLTKRTLNNISISFKDIDSESLLLALDLEGICVSSGSACHSDSMEPSYVLQAIGVPEDYINGTLRISFGKNTTKKEIDYLVDKIKEKIDFIKAV